LISDHNLAGAKYPGYPNPTGPPTLDSPRPYPPTSGAPPRPPRPYPPNLEL
jgi:hypothetical protein